MKLYLHVCSMSKVSIRQNIAYVDIVVAVPPVEILGFFLRHCRDSSLAIKIFADIRKSSKLTKSLLN